MKIMLYEGETTTDILGVYECEFELLPSMTVAIPGGATYYVNKTAKNTTSGSGDPYTVMSIMCKRSTVSADSPGVIPLNIAK
jgi:hypothetical protein